MASRPDGGVWKSHALRSRTTWGYYLHESPNYGAIAPNCFDGGAIRGLCGCHDLHPSSLSGDDEIKALECVLTLGTMSATETQLATFLGIRSHAVKIMS
jgi:hypothetical protein